MSISTKQVVVITGAAAGLGKHRRSFSQNKEQKCVLGARRSNRIDKVVQEISAAGGKAIDFHRCTKRAEVEALNPRGRRRFGPRRVSPQYAALCPSHRIEPLR